MNDKTNFHVVTVGWGHELVTHLSNAIAAKSDDRFSNIVHPRHTPEDWPQSPPQAGVHFFRTTMQEAMPEPDHQLLASLEEDGIPTIHNMIQSDRVLCKVKYVDALGYATFLARRLTELYEQIKPSAIIAGFDSIHSGLALAVARHMNIPWFVLHFCPLPSGYVCFCDRLSPTARLVLREPNRLELRSLAEETMRDFEHGSLQAAAYIAPPQPSFIARALQLRGRIRSAHRISRKARMSSALKYTDGSGSHNLLHAIWHARDARNAHKATSAVTTRSRPPKGSYVFFGLHMQPESSIDVWAPFYSNQMWVLELFSRSIPPTHKLLVKIHKSDLANHSRTQLKRMSALPGVELVAPSVDSKAFIEDADLIVAIQGTMALEAALLGKPVIMLGESPFRIFPSVTAAGKISDLPSLVRKKLKETPPTRESIVDAYAAYLEPFFPAANNRWKVAKTDQEIDGFKTLFDALRKYVLTEKNAD